MVKTATAMFEPDDGDIRRKAKMLVMKDGSVIPDFEFSTYERHGRGVFPVFGLTHKEREARRRFVMGMFIAGFSDWYIMKAAGVSASFINNARSEFITDTRVRPNRTFFDKKLRPYHFQAIIQMVSRGKIDLPAISSQMDIPFEEVNRAFMIANEEDLPLGSEVHDPVGNQV